MLQSRSDDAAKPKELWVFGEEYHPLGGVGADFMGMGADWLVAMLNGKYERSMDHRVYFEKDRTIKEGDGRPLWWEGSATTKKGTRRKK